MTGSTHFDRATGCLTNTSSSGHHRKRQRFPLHNILMRFVLFMVALVLMSIPLIASMSGPPATAQVAAQVAMADRTNEATTNGGSGITPVK